MIDRCSLWYIYLYQRIDPSGKMLEYYKNRGFTMHNDSGHKKYTSYFINEKMKSAVATFYAPDMNLGYKFESYKPPSKPARYADGKPAAQLNFGDNP